MIFPTTRLNEKIKNYSPYKGIFSVYGDFGVGKTTFGLQTLLNTVKLGNDVIFIYTKINFPIKKLLNLINEENKIALNNILNKMLTLQIKNFKELWGLSFNIEFLIIETLKNKKKPTLIVIDSITDLYKLQLNREIKEKNFELNYQLNQILGNLLYFNQNYEIEILIVNDITRSNQDDQTFEIQSGGQVMNYWISNSLKISRTQIPNQRIFELKNHKEEYRIKLITNLTNRGFI